MIYTRYKYYQHSWWGRVGGMVRKRSKQVRKEKPLESPPRMKTFLLLLAAGIEPTTSWFAASLRILVHHPRPLGHRISVYYNSVDSVDTIQNFTITLPLRASGYIPAETKRDSSRTLEAPLGIYKWNLYDQTFEVKPAEVQITKRNGTNGSDLPGRQMKIHWCHY